MRDRCAYDFSDVKDQKGVPWGTIFGPDENIDIIFMSSTSFCLRRLSKLLHFEGTLKNQGKEFQIKIKISKCLWTIYNIRRISSSNSINDNERPKMNFIYLSKTKSFSCVLVNWLNVLFRRDRNLKCDPTKTKLF